MKRRYSRVKSSAFLLITGLLMAYAQITSAQTSDSSLAKTFITLNATGQYQKARQMFAPYLQKEVSEKMLQQIWENNLQSQGAFRHILKIHSVPQDTLNTIIALCDFEKAEITFAITFNPAREIAGYHITGLQAKRKEVKIANLHATTDTSIKVTGGEIAGTLLMPEKKGKIPVVLIIAGSGPTNRDGNSGLALQTNAYEMLADSLAVHGIGSFRYDKRGVGESLDFKKPMEQVRFNDFVNDAIDLVHFLKKDPRFSKVIITGHSIGSLIGMLAAQQTDADAFVSLAGAGEPAGKLLLWQLSQQTGVDTSRVKLILDSLETGHTVKNVPQSLQPIFNPSLQPFLISWFAYDPAKEIAKLRLPVLIINGTTDLQTPVKEAKALYKAKPDAKFILVPGMNHILKNAPAGRNKNIATYHEPDLPLNNQLVERIVNFIQPL